VIKKQEEKLRDVITLDKKEYICKKTLQAGISP